MPGISKFAASYVRKRTSERMDDACKIWAPGAVITDPVTHKAKRAEDTVLYEGKCRFWEVTSGQQIVVGEEQIVMSQTYLSLPYDAPVPEADMVVRITKSADPDLVGRVVNIVSVVRGGGLRASRRFMVQVRDSTKPTW